MYLFGSIAFVNSPPERFYHPSPFILRLLGSYVDKENDTDLEDVDLCVTTPPQREVQSGKPGYFGDYPVASAGAPGSTGNRRIKAENGLSKWN